MKLPLEYFQHNDVTELARDLLGKKIFTRLDDQLTGGAITETEAYAGVDDRAAHSYGGRRTQRTEVMFQPGGVSYIYLCYGLHHMLNFVTNKANIPQAILIRAIQPTIGIDVMLVRRKKQHIDKTLTAGPGSVAQALGLTRFHNNLPLNSGQIWLENGPNIKPESIIVGPRVGVAYAGKDALLPYRFRLKSGAVS